MDASFAPLLCCSDTIRRVFSFLLFRRPLLVVFTLRMRLGPIPSYLSARNDFPLQEAINCKNCVFSWACFQGWKSAIRVET